jgi:hypothetical protein
MKFGIYYLFCPVIWKGFVCSWSTAHSLLSSIKIAASLHTSEFWFNGLINAWLRWVFDRASIFMKSKASRKPTWRRQQWLISVASFMLASTSAFLQPWIQRQFPKHVSQLSLNYWYYMPKTPLHSHCCQKLKSNNKHSDLKFILTSTGLNNQINCKLHENAHVLH